VIDRKDQRVLSDLLEPLGLAVDLRSALEAIPDLYGDLGVLQQARLLAPWPEALVKLDRLEAVLAEFEDDSELLVDLGMARRLSYYTGITFRAYTFDFGQPLLGGGRYDGALLPFAAGFGIGLERLLNALPNKSERMIADVVTLTDVPARGLREAGVWVERALSDDAFEVRSYAIARGIPFLLTDDGLEALGDRAVPAEYLEILEASS